MIKNSPEGIFSPINFIAYLSSNYTHFDKSYRYNLDQSTIVDIFSTVSNQIYSDNGKIFYPSVFSKLADFTIRFMNSYEASNLPLKHKIFTDKSIKQDRAIEGFANAYLAFSFSIFCLHKSTIGNKNKVVENNIELSAHSLRDILTMLCKSSNASQHNLLKNNLSIIYEQLVYKTNPQLQYSLIIK